MTQTHLWILLLSLLMLAEVRTFGTLEKKMLFSGQAGGGGGGGGWGGRRSKEKLVHFVAVPVHEREGGRETGEVAVIVQTRVAVCCIYVGLTTFGIVFIVISFIRLYEIKKNKQKKPRHGRSKSRCVVEVGFVS